MFTKNNHVVLVNLYFGVTALMNEHKRIHFLHSDKMINVGPLDF